MAAAAADGGEDAEADGAEDPEEEGGEESEESASSSEESDPDESAPSRRQQLAQGAFVFRRACDTCHPGGQADLGPSIRGIRMPVARMTRTIRQGTGRMRPVPLGDEAMEVLMVYLERMGAVR